MSTDAMTTLGEFGNAVLSAILWPGEAAISRLEVLAPDTMSMLTFANGGLLVSVILSLAVWTMVIVLLVYAYRVGRHIVRIVGSAFLTIRYRIVLALGALKTRLVFMLRRRRPKRVAGSTIVEPMTEFDNLDVAVLRSMSAKGPGLALSAPDLADEFTMRPAQIQSSLEKLRKNRMLRSAIGSTDGFDNYSLTDTGAAFVSMFQRQRA